MIFNNFPGTYFFIIIFSLVRCLFMSFIHFLISLFDFFYCFRSSPYILTTSSLLLDMWFTNISPHTLHFHSISRSFTEQKIFILTNSRVSIFPFLGHARWPIKFRNSLTLDSEYFLLFFFLKVLSYILRSIFILG